MEDLPKDLISPAEAAELLGTSRQAIVDAIKRGRLAKYEKPVMTTFVSRAEVRRYRKKPAKRGPKPKHD